jgi:hypothetical protein
MARTARNSKQVDELERQRGEVEQRSPGATAYVAEQASQLTTDYGQKSAAGISSTFLS